MSALEVKRAFIYVLPQRRARLGSGEAALLLSQSVCGGSPSSLSLAVSIAMRMSASARVRFSLNASQLRRRRAQVFSALPPARLSLARRQSLLVACGGILGYAAFGLLGWRKKRLIRF